MPTRTENRCLECSGALREEKRDVDYPVDLPFPVRLAGITVTVCEQCGAEETQIPHMATLHRYLAQLVIDMPGRLHPKSIRYLRKWLGWSGRDFARHFETTPETVSRWESGAMEMNAQADILLRHIAENGEPIRDYAVHDDAQATATVELEAHGRGWAMVAA